MRNPFKFLLVAICALISPALHAQSVTVIEAFPNLTFTQPILLTHPPDGTNRIFVVQQDGHILVFPNDSAVTTAKPFLTITSKLSDYTIGGKRGSSALRSTRSFRPTGISTSITRRRIRCGPSSSDTAFKLRTRTPPTREAHSPSLKSTSLPRPITRGEILHSERTGISTRGQVMAGVRTTHTRIHKTRHPCSESFCAST